MVDAERSVGFWQFPVCRPIANHIMQESYVLDLEPSEDNLSAPTTRSCPRHITHPVSPVTIVYDSSSPLFSSEMPSRRTGIGGPLYHTGMVLLRRARHPSPADCSWRSSLDWCSVALRGLQLVTERVSTVAGCSSGNADVSRAGPDRRP